MVRRMTGVIEIEGLRKEYRRLRGGRTIAVDGLDLEVPEGGVFGFLGPNGAGKTTTIRCLLGLVAPSAGTLRLLGSEVPKGLPGVIGKVGAIVETPALFPRFSGRRNLQILARIDGIGKATIEEVLTRVGLADRGDDAVRAYSLGMKQRLGIAAALMKDPQVLVLDEPANGLDPAGHRGGARTRAFPRRRGTHRVHLEPHPVRDPAHRRSGRDPREGSLDQGGPGARGARRAARRRA